MDYKLEDFSCDVHKDCTLIRYSSEKGWIGDQHVHVYVDLDGAWNRNPDDCYMVQIIIGTLLDFDRKTGEAVFDPEWQTQHISQLPKEVMTVQERLSDRIPWADDLNTATKVVKGPGRVLPKPPPIDLGTLTGGKAQQGKP
jgi:hypothetical protein